MYRAVSGAEDVILLHCVTCIMCSFFFFQAEDGIRDHCVTGVQTCALPIYGHAEDFQRALGLLAGEGVETAVVPDLPVEGDGGVLLAGVRSLPGGRDVAKHPDRKSVV